MLHTIQNSALTVTIDNVGAQLMSVTAAGGTEYLWNGQAPYWGGRAPNLFPYVGRLTEDSCAVEGTIYPMGRHGFARRAQFEAVEQAEDRVTLRTQDTEETRKSYPWAFAFSVAYALEGASLHVTFAVENRDRRTLYFGLGAHPGFRVPLEEGKDFTDYRLTFSRPCRPWQVQLSSDYMISGQETPFPLEGGDTLRLRHDLFHHDAVIFHHMDRTVTLSAGPGTRGVTVSFPQMSYLGVWHTPDTDSPFVCLEPWVSLPSRQGIVEDLTQQDGLVRLAPGERYANRWSITVF